MILVFVGNLKNFFDKFVSICDDMRWLGFLVVLFGLLVTLNRFCEKAALW